VLYETLKTKAIRLLIRNEARKALELHCHQPESFCWNMMQERMGYEVCRQLEN